MPTTTLPSNRPSRASAIDTCTRTRTHRPTAALHARTYAACVAAIEAANLGSQYAKMPPSATKSLEKVIATTPGDHEMRADAALRWLEQEVARLELDRRTAIARSRCRTRPVLRTRVRARRRRTSRRVCRGGPKGSDDGPGSTGDVARPDLRGEEVRP